MGPNIQAVISTLLNHGEVALGLLASLYLFILLKFEIQDAIRRQNQCLREIAAKQGTAHQAQACNARYEERYNPTFLEALAYQPPREGLNLQKRVHAMRLLRRGEDEAHIAAALGVPRKEVELLIRVHRLASGSISPAPTVNPR